MAPEGRKKKRTVSVLTLSISNSIEESFFGTGGGI